MWRPLVCLAAATSIAHADDLPTIESAYVPYIEVDPASRVGLDAIELDIYPAVSWLHLELFNTARWGDEPVQLVVPAGTQILGMGFAQETAMRWGALEPRRPAANVFGEDRTGTALLTFEASTTTTARFALLVRGRATVDIALVLPPLARLDVGATAQIKHLIVRVDGRIQLDQKKTRDSGAISLAGVTAEPVDAPHVDAETSLLVDGRDVEPPAPPVDDFPHVQPFIDKAMIRRVLDRHRMQLRRCYTAAVEHAHPTLEGEVMLHFTINGDGNTEDVHVDSVMPDEVTRCLIEQASGWEFPETGGRVQIHYPITFHLSRAPA